MSILDFTINTDLNNLQRWISKTPASTILDNATYEVYEESNPFRLKYDTNYIKNKQLKMGINLSQQASAEFYSLFTNPYYVPHKIIKIPTYYQSIVDTYNKNKIVINKN